MGCKHYDVFYTLVMLRILNYIVILSGGSQRTAARGVLLGDDWYMVRHVPVNDEKMEGLS